MKKIATKNISFKKNHVYINDQMLLNPQGFESIEALQIETANLYIVSESGYGNSALCSIVCAFDETEAVENAQVVEVENVCGIEEITIVN